MCSMFCKWLLKCAPLVRGYDVREGQGSGTTELPIGQWQDLILIENLVMYVYNGLFVFSTVLRV